MEKLLIIHTRYIERGGEDIAVDNEVNFLKNFYNVEFLSFQNTLPRKLSEILSLIISDNYQSRKILSDKIKSFNPDFILINNLWFKGSVGLLRYCLKNNLNTCIKLHNYRYSCTSKYSSAKHLDGNKICPACGLEKNKVGFFNRYYQESMIKSFFAIKFAKRFIQLLENKSLKILTLTNHHKNYLKDLGIDTSRIFLQPNPLSQESMALNSKTKRFNQIVYAGRISPEKGLIELLESWNKLENNMCKLVLLGDGPLFHKLKKYTSKNVEVRGYVNNDEVLKIISQSKAVVTATKLLEGQPTLLCEASVLETPSLFPDVGGIKDFFPKNYKYTFKQYNYEDLYEKLKIIASNPFDADQGKKNRDHLFKSLNNNELHLSLDKALKK
tara:strand:- start:772 stop:1923 length:1152 start_codon:yes stop_codon:yes gene_type:complete